MEATRSRLRVALVASGVPAVFLVMSSGCVSLASDGSSLVTLDSIFAAYCATPNTPGVCRSPAAVPAAVKWLYLTEFCDNNNANPCPDFKKLRKHHRAPALFYDHDEGRWFNGEALKKDVAGVPTVYLPRDHDLKVLVVKTNPLLYRATITESAEEDIGQLANLTRLVGLLSGTAAAATETLGKIPPGAVAAGKATSMKQDVDTAKGYLTDLANKLADVQRLVQDVELASQPVQASCASYTTPRQAIAGHRATLDGHIPSGEIHEDISKAWVAYAAILDADASKWAKVEAAIATFNLLRDSSPVGPKIAALNLQGRSVVSSVNAITNAASLKSEKNQNRTDAEKERVKVDLQRSLYDEVKKLLEAWPEAVKAAAQLELFEKRCNDVIIQGYVPTWIFVETEKKPLKREKRQKHTVGITVSSSFAEGVSMARPKETSATYRLEWEGTRRFDLGFALAYSSLTSPKYAAVTDPDDPSQKVIGQNGEDTRTSTVALFLNYNVIQHAWPSTRKWKVTPSLDLGAGLDTDTPSLFLGGSLRFGKYLRVGAGWTWQEVNELDGQELNEPVASNDDIRTRNTFENDHYVSVMLSLGSLPFFQPKE